MEIVMEFQDLELSSALISMVHFSFSMLNSRTTNQSSDTKESICVHIQIENVYIYIINVYIYICSKRLK